jgi:hypothetical protein
MNLARRDYSIRDISDLRITDSKAREMKRSAKPAGFGRGEVEQ